MTITAQTVGELRNLTDASLDMCKNALRQASGNMKEAENLIRFNRVRTPEPGQLMDRIEYLEKRVDTLAAQVEQLQNPRLPQV